MKFNLALFFILISFGLSAQSFTASVSNRQVASGQVFDVSFVLKGEKAVNFTPPNFGKLKVVSGPFKSSSQSYNNGRYSSEFSYTYGLMANTTGIYIIPSAAIKTSKKTYRTKPIQVKVVKSSPAAKNNDENTYVELLVSDTSALVGQQITLEYKLFTQQNVNGYELLNEPDYDGFFSEELHNYKAAVEKEVVGGKEYYSKIMKKVALFPQRTGAFDIPPVIARLAIPIPGQRRKSFWNAVQTRKLDLSTNPITLIVKSPPSGAPISFSGAIGKYQIKSTINKQQISTDDAFVVYMELSGTGDGKTFSAAKQRKMDNFESYDPNVVRDEDTSRDGIISNYKKIEYLYVPKKPGNYIIRPEFSYYDTDQKKYVTLSPNVFKVRVTQGTRTVTVDDRDVSVTQNFQPNRDESGNASSFFLKFFDPFWYGSFFGSLGFLFFIGIKKYKQDQHDNLDPAEKKKLAALKLATAKLEKAKNFQEQNDSRSFYEELSTTMNGYLGNKYDLDNADFNKENIVAALHTGNANSDQIASYLDILKSCEIAIFAGQSSSKMDGLYEKSLQLILDMENGPE